MEFINVANIVVSWNIIVTPAKFHLFLLMKSNKPSRLNLDVKIPTCLLKLMYELLAPNLLNALLF